MRQPIAKRISGCLKLAILLFSVSGAVRGATPGFVLEVEMANPGGGSAALFYDIGQWYNQRDVSRLDIPAGSELHAYRFAIPPAPIRRLRFDLTDRAGLVMIGRFRLMNANGDVLDDFGPEFARPMHSIEGYTISNGVALVKAGSGNPMLLIDRLLQPKTEAALDRALIGAPTLMLLAIAVAGAMVYSVAVALRSMPDRRLAGCFFSGAFLVVLGIRLAWIGAYGSPMPYWDEWEMDGVGLLMPLRGHFLDWGALLVPQSEHRTLVSRLIVLVGSLLDGEWDPRVAMVAGAVMYAVSTALVCALAAGLRLRLAILAVAAVVVLAVFPFDPRNLLCGDQCQMYALNLMAIVVLCLSVAQPSRAIIAAAALASAVSLFTMASGCVAPLLAAGIVFARAPRMHEGRRRGLILGAVFLCAGVAGLMLYRAAPFQAPAYAHTLRNFSVAFVERLSWPLTPGAGHIVLLWLPWLMFAGSLLPPRRSLGPMDGFLLCLGVWVIANAAALAHGRPSDHWPFDNKYYTSMLLVAVCAVLSLLQLAASRRTAVFALVGLFSATPAAIAIGSMFAKSPEAAHSYWRQESAYGDVIRPYLRTGNRSLLYDLDPSRLPYWNGAELAAQLDSPLMQPWLPAALRQRLSLRPGTTIHGDQAPGPLTMICLSAMKAGPFLALAGVCLIAVGVVVGTRRQPPDDHESSRPPALSGEADPSL